jgi:hypothetical protein
LPPRRPRAHRLRRSAPVSSASPCLLSPRPQAYSKEASQALGTNSALHPDSLPGEKNKNHWMMMLPCMPRCCSGSPPQSFCVQMNGTPPPRPSMQPQTTTKSCRQTPETPAPPARTSPAAPSRRKGEDMSTVGRRFGRRRLRGYLSEGVACGPPHSSGRSGAQGDATLMVPWNPCPDPHSMSHAKT